MPKTKLLILAIYLLFSSFTSIHAAWNWNTSIGGTLDDKPKAISGDINGNIYVSGEVKGSNIIIDGTSYSTNGQIGIYLAKYTESGQNLWEKMLLADGDAKVNGISADIFGNVYITGSFTGSQLYISDTILSNNGVENIFLLKYNGNGNFIWGKVFGGDAIDIANAIVATYDTCIYIGGKFSSDTVLFDSKTAVCKGQYDAFILKCNSKGQVSWCQAFGNSGSEEITSIDTYIASDVVVSGNFDSDSIQIGLKKIKNKGAIDFFIYKFSKTGSCLMAVSFGGTADDKSYSIRYDEGSLPKVHLTGEFNSSQITFNSTIYTNQGGKDAFILILNPSGTVAYSKVVGSSGDELFSSIDVADPNLLHVAGSFENSSLSIDTFTLYSNGLYDGMYLRLDSTLQTLTAQSIGGNGNDEMCNVVSTSFKGIYTYISGKFESNELSINNDTVINKGVSDIFIAMWSDSALTNSGNPFNTINIATPNDGGLYGGVILDLTYSNYNKRLFSGMLTPAALFYSDDTAKTWVQAFPTDSLEYNQATKGWGGSANRILTNSKGWVVLQTAEPRKGYTAAVVSYNGGDNWSTFIDPQQLSYLGFQDYAISATGLNEYYIYVAAGTYLMRGNASGLDTNSIIDVSTYISGLLPQSIITNFAVPNSSSGYPIYFTIDVYGSQLGYERRLFKYNGSAFSEISLSNLTAINGIREIFTHPGQVTGDTLFISAKDKNTHQSKIYRSYNAGFSWADVSYTNATTFLHDVEYSPSWVSQLTSSNGLILIIPGNAISKDLGANWESNIIPFYGNTIHPDNPSFIIGGRNKVSYSNTGYSGAFSTPTNTLLQALTINKIARTEDKKIFYVATIAGVGYSTAYLDTNISGGAKWASPYGAYPIVQDTTNFGAIAINPHDSGHVIAGCPYGFYVTKTGVSGFGSLITPAGFGTDDPQVNDIAILTSDIALAVTGGKDSAKYSGMGNIWRSVSGGDGWINVSPTGFSNGNTISIALSSTDTIIYIGTGLSNIDTGFIWKSVNLGSNWTKVNSGPPSISGNGVSGLTINDIDVIPGSTDSFYIAAGDEESYAFVLTPDGGLTYEHINLQGSSAFTSVAINQTHTDSVYIAIDKDIYVYEVSTNTFCLVYEGLPGERVPDLMHGSIIAGTTTGFYTFHPTWEDIVTSIDEEKNIQNEDNRLVVYPNPLSNQATLKIVLEEKTNIRLSIYDIMGQKVQEKNYGVQDAGPCELAIHTESLKAGNYFISIQMSHSFMHRKVLVVK